jgi:hypothetical protein
MKIGVVSPLVFLALTVTALAQSAGTFTPAGNMTTPRLFHTATLLTNGKVLITGGAVSDSDDTQVNSELYDPATGIFAASGMIWGIPLSDGRLLIFTGPRTAETYDPLTAAFQATGDMVAQPYSTRLATSLQDGRIFIAGYPTAQIYDPYTGTFAATRPYAASLPAILQSSTLLADGRVLLTGAVNICYEAQCREPGTSWTEIYDPRSGTFIVAGNMNWWNNIYTATLLLSGKVLFVGGDNYNAIPSSAELFDPSNGTFTLIESPLANLQYSATTLLPDGTVLITGGLRFSGEGEAVSELYLPETGKFAGAGNMITPRYGHTATLLTDGTVLIAGGSNCVPGPPTPASPTCPNGIANAEIFRPAVLYPSPVLFTLAVGGSQGAIWHSDTGQIASPEHPTVAGDILSMYVTGIISGSVIPPQVAIGGRLAEVSYFGSAPGYPRFSQVNVRVPSGIAQGPTVHMRLTYLGRPSNEVTIGVGQP